MPKAGSEETGTSRTTITIPVIGMSCAACQSHVERALQKTPGVGSAEVNLMTHSARVIFDPLFANPEMLIAAVRESGYESSLPAADDAAPELHSELDLGSLGRRAFSSCALATMAMLLSMPLMQGMRGSSGFFSNRLVQLAPLLSRVPVQGLEVTLFVCTLAGMALAAGEVYKPAWNALLHRTTNMNTLVAIGTISALLYSAAATFVPSLFFGHGLRPDVYYESVLFIVAFLMLGRWLEGRAKVRTQDALQTFTRLQPQFARVCREGQEIEVPVASVQAGETLVLRPGERVAVDGIVLEGSSSVDESLLTGESLPVPRMQGDRLIGGSLNYDGALEYRATSVGRNGVLGQMLRLMQEAQSSRAPTQLLADRVSAVFVPSVLIISTLTFLGWLALDHGNFSYAFASAVTVLVIACPCAMGLAVPAALTVAIGRAAQLGILFKSGEALERIARIDTVVLDKTGTLTEGKPRIRDVRPADGHAEETLLQLAASLEQRSEHPLARAVLRRAAEAGLTLTNASAVRAIPGKGITGVVDGHSVAAGNAALFLELGIDPPALPSQVEPRSTLLLAIDGSYHGYLTAQDEIRSGAAEAIAALKRRGMRVLMLTGDDTSTAKAVAADTGIDEFYGNLLPEGKLRHIQALQADGRTVAMVGDGINDAASLAQADAGIAMGSGSDLAREAGDAVLLRGEPQSIVAAVDLARATLRTMRANLGWAVGYNILGIPIAAGVLYPIFGILLSPAIASAAMALSSISVLANSLRLRRFNAG